MTRQPLRLAIRAAQDLLVEAGVASPRADAEQLAAYVLGVERGRLPLVPLVDPSAIDRLRALTERRASRVPLQHILGTAVMGAVEVHVGEGVFVPRPETELLLEWALTTLEDVANPLVFDLCTGSGALALAIANARPDARVHAVEIDPVALSWARRNADERAAAGDTPISLYSGDVTAAELFTEYDGMADLVVCNPPYVPLGAEVPVEVAEHDPAIAVFSGADGLDVIRRVVSLSARLLRNGGALGIEHDDTNGAGTVELLTARRVLTDVVDHQDLNDRPRFATATRKELV